MSTENELSHFINSESENPTQERLWVPSDVDIITISGHPGTGKTVVGQQLAEMYGMEYVKVGDLFRQFVRDTSGKEVVGYTPRSEDMDQMLDDMQRLLMRDARSDGRKIILEGRLAGVIATEEQEKARLEHAPISRIQRILFIADRDERTRRVLNRYPNYSEEEARSLTKEREEKDLETWKQFHPSIEGVKDIYDPLLENTSGLPRFFDICVDTTYKSIHEVKDTVHERLVENGSIERNDATHSIPLTADIFDLT